MLAVVMGGCTRLISPWPSDAEWAAESKRELDKEKAARLNRPVTAGSPIGVSVGRAVVYPPPVTNADNLYLLACGEAVLRRLYSSAVERVDAPKSHPGTVFVFQIAISDSTTFKQAEATAELLIYRRGVWISYVAGNPVSIGWDLQHTPAGQAIIDATFPSLEANMALLLHP